MREITHRTGSSIRSWNENVKVRGKDRKVRTLIIEVRGSSPSLPLTGTALGLLLHH